jgi:ribonuclease P protein component
VLDRRHRLTTSAGFTTATRRGRRVGTRTLVLHVAAATDDTAGAGPAVHGPSDPEPRVGFVVSKAIGNAVHRNRVKRRLRHLARERLEALPRGGILVVRALPASSGAGYRELGRDFDVALRRLGLVDASVVDA